MTGSTSPPAETRLTVYRRLSVGFAGRLLALTHRHFDTFLVVVLKKCLVEIETNKLMALSKENDVEKYNCCSKTYPLSTIKFAFGVLVMTPK